VEIPSSYPYTHSFATPTYENRVTCKDTQGLSVHTLMLPRPVRSQVACGDALYGNPHTFRRQKCLQSLHAFKGDNDPHLHFEDDNIFSHCMPSKATMSSFTFRRRQYLQSLHAFKGDNVLIYISKMTMSSPQKLQYLFPLCFVGLDVLCLYAF